MKSPNHDSFYIQPGFEKCQSELVGDQKLNKITSESQSQKLARKLSWKLQQCDGGARWVFLLVTELSSCCMGVELQQVGNVRYGRRSVVEL
jgi:hypothetical protein